PVGVQVVGPVHRLAFFVFVWSAIEAIAANPNVWTWQERLWLFAGAMLPFGGMLNTPMMRRKSHQPVGHEST
ncbi:MAG: DUF3817 domain-containing protein, partial [Pseudomonadota bacterium]